MTNAILRGKPDAGNPHVRFDEGEVASYPPTVGRPEGVATRGAKPRRGSLLYKKIVVVVGFLLCAFGAGAAETWYFDFSAAGDCSTPANAAAWNDDWRDLHLCGIVRLGADGDRGGFAGFREWRIYGDVLDGPA